MTDNKGPIYGQDLPPETQLPMPSGMQELTDYEELWALKELAPGIHRLIGAYEAVSHHRNELQKRFDNLYALYLDALKLSGKCYEQAKQQQEGEE